MNFSMRRTGGKQLKYIYDTTDTKIFITGSSAIEFAVSGLRRLLGRVISFTLYQLLFKEFLQFKKSDLERITHLPSAHKQMLPLYKEFLRYGGYPRVVLENKVEKKKRLLQEILNVYLLRDIRDIFQIQGHTRFLHLIEALAAQQASRVSWSNLRDITGYNQKDLKTKVTILEKTFISSFIRPFFTNKQKELVKNPKVFFIDPGFRNAVLDTFTIDGTLHECFVFSEAVKAGKMPKYWRKKSGAEVDFVIDAVLLK